MQPTADEIELEKEALRDIRRRSVAQVAELDPDLPSTSATSSSSSLNEDGKPVVDASDPSHLFWVPAHVHPELAPGEFKAFIKDHASIQRALSHRSQGGMSRRRSVLSQQLRPGASDDGEDEQAEQPVVQPRRRGTRRENMSTLTLEELQEIEDLAEQANNDPTELRNILRRSLSLSATSQESEDPDAPIVPHLPGQMIRRTARTKIRKPGAGIHGFTSRRAGTLPLPAPKAPATQADISQEELPSERRHSFSEESSIFDSYAITEESNTSIVDEPNFILERSPSPPSLPTPTASPSLSESLSSFSIQSDHSQYTQQQPLLQQPTPLRPDESFQSSTSPPPEELSSQRPQLKKSKSSSERVKSSPSRKEKEKKGLFGLKKSKDKDKGKEKEKEKDAGFFGSFFGGSKKKQDEHPPVPGPSGLGPSSSQLTTPKQSKSRSTSPAHPSPSPILMPGGPYARYPIAVERAVYRLSHIKLANPRRPLLEQVLISNLMFWYLGIINKQNQPQQTVPTPQNGSVNTSAGETAEESYESQQRSQAEWQEREEMERRERAEREAQEREREAQQQAKRENGKRGSLTKAGRDGLQARRAEIPVRGPQYDVQHLEIEQQYGDVGVGGGGGRVVSGSRHSMPNQTDHSMHQTVPNYPTSQSQPIQITPSEWGYLGSGSPASDQPQVVYQSLPATQYSPQPYYPTSSTSNGLPPGAMRPAQVEHSWASGYSQSVAPNPPQSAPPYNRGYSRSTSPSPPNSRSPSSDGDRNLLHKSTSSRPNSERQSSSGSYSRSASVGGSQPSSHRSSPPPSGKLTGRSLSATAVMVNTSNHFSQSQSQEETHQHRVSAPSPSASAPPPSADHRPKLKKRPSAGSPVLPVSRSPPHIQMQQRYDGVEEEEEDMPLAVWQEQQQQRSRRR